MKKQLHLILGLVLLASAGMFIGNAAELEYGDILRKRIANDDSLRRFSAGIRSGNGQAYLEQKTTKTYANAKRVGTMRPRAMVGVVSVDYRLPSRRTTYRGLKSYQADAVPAKKFVDVPVVKKVGIMRPRVVVDASSVPKNVLPSKKTTIRTTTVAPTKKSKFVATKKHSVLDVNFKALTEKIVKTESFVFSLPVEFLTTSKSNISFTAQTHNGIKLKIQYLNDAAVGSFETSSRGILTTQMQKTLGLSSQNQSTKLAAHFGKNQIKYLQTPPTNYFEKVSQANGTVITQRLQKNPNGGLIYMEVVAPAKLSNQSLNLAHKVFNSFNLY